VKTYAFSFLSTDIVGEIWGKEKAKQFVKYGFGGQLFSTILITITGMFPTTISGMEEAYKTVLGQNWVFFIGSMCAYCFSQTWIQLVGVAVGQYLLKACLALLDTPFFYFFTRHSKTNIEENN
jgi:uncharacterized PurR-regulated membrane protein YhhQ (DUF165 family)